MPPSDRAVVLFVLVCVLALAVSALVRGHA